MATIDDFPNLRRVLDEYGREVAARYKSNLRESGHGTQPDHLINTIKTEVVMNDTAFVVTMELNKYWKYLENGTRPHWPPVDAIREWISYKPVLPRPDASGRIPSPEQLAFLIGRKIAKVGTQGSHDLEKAKDVTLSMWEQRLRLALAEDMRTYLYTVLG